VINILHQYRRLEISSSDDAADVIVALFERSSREPTEEMIERALLGPPKGAPTLLIVELPPLGPGVDKLDMNTSGRYPPHKDSNLGPAD
jgi:hypothetical protein